MLFRTSLAAVGVALALAGCQGATPVDKAEPDTAPQFSGSVANQTYKALQDIEALTLPRATGGNGDLRYSLHPEDQPPGLSFNSGTRKLSGMPFQTVNKERVRYRMTYRVEDSDDNTSSRDADTIEFTITIQPKPSSKTWWRRLPSKQAPAGSFTKPCRIPAVVRRSRSRGAARS